MLARNLINPRSWQQKNKIQDLGKKFKIIQDYPRSWQENQDAKHWATSELNRIEPSKNVRAETSISVHF